MGNFRVHLILLGRCKIVQQSAESRIFEEITCIGSRPSFDCKQRREFAMTAKTSLYV